jgi:hypothetical protein
MDCALAKLLAARRQYMSVVLLINLNIFIKKRESKLFLKIKVSQELI